MRSLSEFMAEQRLAADRKAARIFKRLSLPWGRRKDQEATGTAPSRQPKIKRALTARQTLIRQLDAIWSQIILLRHRARFGPMCRICMAAPAQVAYHIVPKQRGYAIRWDLENGCGACSPCNGAEMMNRSLYREKHILLFTRQFVEKIESRANAMVKFDIPDLKSKLEAFKEIIRVGGWR